MGKSTFHEGAHMNRLRSTMGIYGFHELKKLWPFLNTPIRPGIIRSGMKLSLLTETLTCTLVELRRLSTWDFTLTTSTGTVERRFLKRGCLQSDNMTTYNLHRSGLLRDQFLPLIMPTILWIETHQPWATFVIHQSLTIMVVQIVRLSKSTLSPDEDLQCSVEKSQSISKWQSQDKW